MSEEPQRPSPASPSVPPQPGELRVSDQDRERVITALNEHAGAGRISTEELEDRVQAVYDAKTKGELDAVRRVFTVMTISPFPILPSTPSLSRTIAVLAALFVNR